MRNSELPMDPRYVEERNRIRDRMYSTISVVSVRSKQVEGKIHTVIFDPQTSELYASLMLLKRVDEKRAIENLTDITRLPITRSPRAILDAHLDKYPDEPFLCDPIAVSQLRECTKMRPIWNDLSKITEVFPYILVYHPPLPHNLAF